MEKYGVSSLDPHQRVFTNEQAYGGRSFEERLATRFNPGDHVEVGPGYRMGGSYERDGSEGFYTVKRELAPSPVARGIALNPDYLLVRGLVSLEEALETSWDVACTPARLTKVGQ